MGHTSGGLGCQEGGYIRGMKFYNRRGGGGFLERESKKQKSEQCIA